MNDVMCVVCGEEVLQGYMAHETCYYQQEQQLADKDEEIKRLTENKAKCESDCWPAELRIENIKQKGQLAAKDEVIKEQADEIETLRKIAEIKDPEQHFEQIMESNKLQRKEIERLKQELRHALDFDPDGMMSKIKQQAAEIERMKRNSALTIVDTTNAEIERLKKTYYSFQLTGDEDSNMVQFEFEYDNRELEIEFSQDMQVTYLKVKGDVMEENVVVSAQQLLSLLQWLKGIKQ